MNLKAVGRLGQEFFELRRCLWKALGVVLRYCSLKLAIQFLTGSVLQCGLGWQSAK
jgi:hypothetical protein